MCLGVFPSAQIAAVYGLPEYLALSQAIIQGNLVSYHQIMAANSALFIQHGVYLVLEKTKMLLYRNLFKRIYIVNEKNTRINLLWLEAGINIQLEALQQQAMNTSTSSSNHTSLNLLEIENTDLDEIECLLSNLIFQNRMKGYISHEKRFLILSKVDPFPSSAVIKKYSPSSG